MTNYEIKIQLFKKVSRVIEWRMNEMQETYVQAKVIAKENSVAGPAVWEMLDKTYA